MVTGRAVFSWYGLGVEACDGGRTESAPLWSLTVMSMFTCHCEVAPAQPVGGGTETEQVLGREERIFWKRGQHVRRH